MSKYTWGLDGKGRQVIGKLIGSGRYQVFASPINGYQAKCLIWDLEEQDKS